MCQIQSSSLFTGLSSFHAHREGNLDSVVNASQLIDKTWSCDGTRMLWQLKRLHGGQADSEVPPSPLPDSHKDSTEPTRCSRCIHFSGLCPELVNDWFVFLIQEGTCSPSEQISEHPGKG